MIERESTSSTDWLETLPWWVGVLAGALAFLIVGLAIPSLFASDTVEPLQATWPLASILFGAGVALSLATIIRTRASLTAPHSNSLGSVLKLAPAEFTHHVAEAFERRGYNVVENRDGAHVGVDIVMLKAGRMYFIQCKHWQTFQADVQPLRDLRALMDNNEIAGGFFITAGVFTREARTYAAKANIELIGGSQLLQFLHTDESHTTIEPIPEPVFISSTALTVPVCPSCGDPMTRRTAKRGKNAGEEFWGCPNYPKCKGTKRYE